MSAHKRKGSFGNLSEMFKRNSLATTLLMPVLLAGFIVSIVVLGKVGQLNQSQSSDAAIPGGTTVTFPEITCTNAKYQVAGFTNGSSVNYKYLVKNSSGQVYTESQFNFIIEGANIWDVIPFRNELQSNTAYTIQIVRADNGTALGSVRSFTSGTCAGTPATTLGNVTSTCTEPGVMTIRWTAHTGADHYTVEIFKPRTGQGPRVFGQVATNETTFVARDPDLAGGVVQADVYAQNAQGQNIAGPAFASPVTCPAGQVFSGSHASLSEAQCGIAGIAGTITLQMNSSNTADNGEYRIRIDKMVNNQLTVGYAYSRDVINFKTTDSWLTNVAPILTTLGTGDYKYQLEKKVNGTFVSVSNVVFPSSGYHRLTCPAAATTAPSAAPGVTFAGSHASLSEAQCTVAGIAGTITLQLNSNNTADNGDYRIRIDKKVNNQLTVGYAFSRDVISFRTTDSWLTNVAPILTTLGTGDYRYQLEKKVNGTFIPVRGVTFPTSATAYHRLTCSGNNPTSIPSPTAVTSAAPVCINNTADVVLAMDVSGSMDSKSSGVKRIEAAKEAAKSFLGLLPNKRQARAGVVTYNRDAKLVGGLTTDMNSLISKINFKASGGTGIAAGITKADEQFGTANKTNIVILMTDGKANSPRPAGISDPDNPAVAPFARLAAFDAAARSIEAHKTVFYTVGFGKSTSVDTELLSGIARLSNTSPYMASNPNTFVDIFERLPSEICNDAPVSLNRALYNQIRGQLAQ
jgi:hypothetical protein